MPRNALAVTPNHRFGTWICRHGDRSTYQNASGGLRLGPGAVEDGDDGLRRLSAGDDEALVDPEERHAVDADLHRRGLVGPHVLGVLAVLEHAAGVGFGDAGLDGERHERVRVTDAAALGEGGGEQTVLELRLATE